MKSKLYGVLAGLVITALIICVDQVSNAKTKDINFTYKTETETTDIPRDEVETYTYEHQNKKTTYEKNLEKYGLESDEDLEFFCKCVFQEVRGSTYKCKRLVVDVILNRADKRKDKSVRKVITAKGQFSVYPSMMDSTPNYKNMSDTDKKAWDDSMRAIKGELARKKKKRASNEVLYFRSRHYHTFGTPVIHEGSEYFSK